MGACLENLWIAIDYPASIHCRGCVIEPLSSNGYSASNRFRGCVLSNRRLAIAVRADSAIEAFWAGRHNIFPLCKRILYNVIFSWGNGNSFCCCVVYQFTVADNVICISIPCNERRSIWWSKSVIPVNYLLLERSFGNRGQKYEFQFDVEVLTEESLFWKSICRQLPVIASTTRLSAD
jgi:hypothetical protein